MSLVIPPGFGLAAWVFTGSVGTQPYVTTCGVDLTAAGGDYAAAANAAFVAYADAFLPATSAGLTLDRVTLSIGQDGPGGSVDSGVAPQDGVSTAQFPPTAQSAILRKNSAQFGRFGRGRMFLPGVVNEGVVEQNGSITESGLDAVSALAITFYENLVNGVDLDPLSMPLPPVILHSETIALAPTPCTSFSVSNLVGWVRGRIR